MRTRPSHRTILSIVAVALAWLPTELHAQFAYVANADSNDVSGFRIDSTTGALTPIPGSPFPAGSGPSSVAVDPAGRFAYVANGDSADVSGYRIDSTTGALTPIPGSPVPAEVGPRSVAVDPRGRFVYVTSTGSVVPPLLGNVSGYTINSTSGELTPVPGSPFPLPEGWVPQSVAVDPSGRFVYLANRSGFPSGSDNVSGYTIASTTGALTPITGSPFPAGLGPSSVAVDPSGTFAYVANLGSESPFGGGNVSGYTINSTSGALTPIPGSPFPAGSVPDSVAVDPSGRFAYVANSFVFVGGNSVSGYTIDSTSGALTPISGSPFPAGLVPKSVAVDPSGRFAYVANGGRFPRPGNVSAFTIDSTTGSLTPIPGSPFPTGATPVSVAVATVSPPVFAGTSGTPNCHGESLSALAREFGGLEAAASALGFASAQALHEAIRAFCRR
jgi:DNA-binding beta-propeller fold protein YncE